MIQNRATEVRMRRAPEGQFSQGPGGALKESRFHMPLFVKICSGTKNRQEKLLSAGFSLFGF